MIKNIINNTVFRVFTPIFYGVTMYILILLIFGSIQQLSDNFFSIEIVLNILITYLLFETSRLYILQVDKRCSADCSINRRIAIQLSGCIFISLLLTSLIISFYFSKLVGFNTYRTELVVFNVIFLISSILYNMVYFSFFYLNRINISQLEKEEILRKNVELELDTFKNKINKDFLYDSLETLISLSKRNIDESDRFILKLSEVYRNILSAKNSDLVSIEDEIKVSNILIELYNYKFNGNINLHTDQLEHNTRYSIISGTMVVIIEDIVNQSIISDIQKLDINCTMINAYLQISHSVHDKLIPVNSKQTELNYLKKAYFHHGEKEFFIEEKNQLRTYHIPIFELEN